MSERLVGSGIEVMRYPLMHGGPYDGQEFVGDIPNEDGTIGYWAEQLELPDEAAFQQFSVEYQWRVKGVPQPGWYYLQTRDGPKRADPNKKPPENDGLIVPETI